MEGCVQIPFQSTTTNRGEDREGIAGLQEGVEAIGQEGAVAPVDEDVNVGVEAAMRVEHLGLQGGVAGDDAVDELAQGGAGRQVELNLAGADHLAQGGVEIDGDVHVGLTAFRAVVGGYGTAWLKYT
jgi:hypothetical protein